MADVVALARRLGLRSPDALLSVVVGAYGEDAVEYQHGGIEDVRLTCEAVVRHL